MAERSFADSWTELADALGVTPRTIKRWRQEFPHMLPRAVGGRHDVDAWRRFVWESERRAASNIDPATLPRRQAPRDGDDYGPAVACVCDWDDRESFLVEVLELVFTAYYKGQITLTQLADISESAPDAVVALAKALQIPTAKFDPVGFRRNWTAILAEIGRTVHAASRRR